MRKQILFILFVFLFSLASSTYAQSEYLRDSLIGIFQKERIKDFSFVMDYSTLTMIHKYGFIYLKGYVRHGALKLYLHELQDINRKKAKWVKHSLYVPIILEDSLIRLSDSLFFSRRIPPILKKERLDIIRYDEQNFLQIKIKRKKKYENYDIYFGDYSPVQIISDTEVTYSSQMIKWLKLLETIIESQGRNLG